MRRKDREITDRAEMEAILAEAPVCRLAMADGTEPYVVPLCFAYAADDNAIYFHSAREGKKIGMLENNPRCCVEVDISDGPLPDKSPCSWEFRYRSVICTGTAHVVSDPGEKNRALNCIIRHYGECDHPFTEKELDRVCVVKIVIGEMTGKKHGY
ncbi:MAG TPA: pyridoxamine 5'-phosphate oxidase family protein [Methanoregula sp.]|nr:pyridoxamine 5'-phosphate oxidase family protein [Methanoregula sp.]